MSASIKRSRHLRLVLMAAAVPTLAACDGEPSGRVMTSLEECKTQTEIPVADCEASYRKALAEHERLAPRFADSAQCNEQFGNCEPKQDANGDRSWAPSMNGFLLGYIASGMINGRATGYRAGGNVPLYRDYRSGDYLRPDGGYVSKGGGLVKGKYGNTQLPARAMTISRSGFGSSASARGGFGSSRRSGG